MSEFLSPGTLRTLAQALETSGYRGLAVHWDMDGTLVESEPLHIEKLITGAARYGVTLTPEHFTTLQHFDVPDGQGGWRAASMVLHGAGDKNCYYWLCQQRPCLRESLALQTWLDELQAYYLAHGHDLQARAGVSAVVSALGSVGVVQSIVTSATQPQVAVCANALRVIQPHIAFILTADDVTRFKPEPQCYLRAKDRADALLEARGLHQDCVLHVAVEDSPTGVRAALAAGMPCVHFVLEGQAPFNPGAGQDLQVARDATELALALARFLTSEDLRLRRLMQSAS